MLQQFFILIWEKASDIAITKITENEQIITGQTLKSKIVIFKNRVVGNHGFKLVQLQDAEEELKLYVLVLGTLTIHRSWNLLNNYQSDYLNGT